MVLAVNDDESRMESQITDNSYKFDVKEFGTAISTNNAVSLEIKRRLILVNSCYFDLNRQLSSRDLSRATKLTLYKFSISVSQRSSERSSVDNN